MTTAPADAPPMQDDFRFDIDLSGDYEFENVGRMVDGLINSVPPTGFRLESCLDRENRRLQGMWEDDLSCMMRALGVSLEQMNEDMDRNSNMMEYCRIMQTEHADPTANVMVKIATAVGVAAGDIQGC